MKSILSIILIVAAALLFFFFTKPKLAELSASQLEVSQLNIAEAAAKKLEQRIAKLVEANNSISDEDKTKIETMVPNSVENVKLIIDFDKTLQAMTDERGTAALYARNNNGSKISIENPKVTQSSSVSDGNFDASKLGVVSFSFSVSLTYGDFIEFLRRLEHSTRIIDVESISFSAVSPDSKNSNQNDPIYTFNVGLKTYWLKYTTEANTKTN